MQKHAPEPIPLAPTPEAAAEAAKFGVPSAIHALDFIYWHLIGVQPRPESAEARAHVTEYYFADGSRSARRLDEIVRRYHPQAGQRRLALLEFASGYGCVSRHLAKFGDAYDLVACDIHDQALRFLREAIGVAAIPSHADPARFVPQHSFDVVFALSFFSHMPDRTFLAWLAALFGTLSEDGLLVFTTHGRVAYESLNRPPLQPDGYWFVPASEQKDLSTQDYGSAIVTPSYVVDRLSELADLDVLLFEQGSWWDTQDVFVARKVPSDFRPTRPSAHALWRSVSELREERAQLGADLASSLQAREAAEADRDRVVGSRSWRWTAPLRRARSLLR